MSDLMPVQVLINFAKSIGADYSVKAKMNLIKDNLHFIANEANDETQGLLLDHLLTVADRTKKEHEKFENCFLDETSVYLMEQGKEHFLAIKKADDLKNATSSIFSSGMFSNFGGPRYFKTK